MSNDDIIFPKRKNMKIYTKFGKQETVEQFLDLLYDNFEYSQEAHTVETYSDEACTIVQCLARKMRSFDDLYDMITTYYEDVTPKDLMHSLLTLKKKDKHGTRLYLYMYHCSTIMRVRCHYDYNLYACIDAPFGCSKYNSKYSWQELLKMLNIETREDLRNYINNN